MDTAAQQCRVPYTSQPEVFKAAGSHGSLKHKKVGQPGLNPKLQPPGEGWSGSWRLPSKSSLKHCRPEGDH